MGGFTRPCPRGGFTNYGGSLIPIFMVGLDEDGVDAVDSDDDELTTATDDLPTREVDLEDIEPIEQIVTK